MSEQLLIEREREIELACQEYQFKKASDGLRNESPSESQVNK